MKKRNYNKNKNNDNNYNPPIHIALSLNPQAFPTLDEYKSPEKCFY